jgi:CheY-like chemotaxis protein
VDDEADTLQLLALVLADRGAVVRTAESVDEALKLLPGFLPDVVVSDLAMPWKDGFDLIREIRGMAGPISGVPAVATTAYARTEDADRALQAGFTRHMAKPVDGEALAHLISELAAQSGSALRPGQRCGASQNGPSRLP